MGVQPNQPVRMAEKGKRAQGMRILERCADEERTFQGG